MDEKAEQLIAAFASAANRPLLHHEDWRRFFEFIVYVYKKNLPVTGWNVSTRLFAHNFPNDLVARLSADFDNFRELLEVYDQKS